MANVKVRFLRDYADNDGTDDPVRYKGGRVYSMRADAAQHYIRRRVAEDINPAKAAKKLPTAQPVPVDEKAPDPVEPPVLEPVEPPVLEPVEPPVLEPVEPPAPPE